MNRRAAAWVVHILLAVSIMGASFGSPASVEAGTIPDTTISDITIPVTTVPVTTIPVTTIPVTQDTVNDFFPEERDLTDCLGALERPGCGSSARGGWGQTAVFGVMITGLLVVFGRIIWGARRTMRS